MAWMCITSMPGEEALRQAMAVFTVWLDGQLGNSDHAVDQGAVSDFCLF
jgi:hypothetical protein